MRHVDYFDKLMDIACNASYLQLVPEDVTGDKQLKHLGISDIEAVYFFVLVEETFNINLIDQINYNIMLNYTISEIIELIVKGAK